MTVNPKFVPRAKEKQTWLVGRIGTGNFSTALGRDIDENRMLDGRGVVIDQAFHGSEPAAVVPAAGKRLGAEHSDETSHSKQDRGDEGVARSLGEYHAPSLVQNGLPSYRDRIMQTPKWEKSNE